MNATTLLILVLSQGGHWLSGTENTVRAQWVLADRTKLPAIRMEWELKLDQVKLAGGIIPLDPAKEGAELKLVCPQVRARVVLQLAWRVVAQAEGKELAAGSADIDAYPSDLTEGWAKVIDDKRLVVIDPEGKLSALLTAAKVPFSRISDRSRIDKVALGRPEMVIVAPGALEGSRFEQTPLVDLAKSGASVMIFRQTRPEHLGEYEVALRGLPKQLAWDADQPLLRPFTADDLAGWQASFPSELEGVRLPADEPAIAVCRWPSDAPAGRLPKATVLPATPTDALLVVKKVGQGRLVLCQIPLGDWAIDPRSQQFLGAALDYLTTRPEPTPPPALPAATRPVDPGDRKRTIIINPGD